MSYKTILVHADLGIAAPARIRLAARLARASGAHLVGSAPTGVSRFVPPEVLAAGIHPLAARCRELREEARRALELVERIAAEEGVASCEARLVDDELDGGMAPQARYCDLAVVGQGDRTLVDPLVPADLPEYLLATGGHPVLVLPGRPALPALAGEAVVAWDGGIAAMRAVAGALPLLRMARRVTVLAFGDGLPATELAEEPCSALVTWLGRHGIAARPSRRPRPPAIGHALLDEVADLGAELLVMGANGRARLRSTLDDGATATVLRWAQLPVLLAH